MAELVAWECARGITSTICTSATGYEHRCKVVGIAAYLISKLQSFSTATTCTRYACVPAVPTENSMLVSTGWLLHSFASRPLQRHCCWLGQMCLITATLCNDERQHQGLKYPCSTRISGLSTWQLLCLRLELLTSASAMSSCICALNPVEMYADVEQLLAASFYE